MHAPQGFEGRDGSSAAMHETAMEAMLDDLMSSCQLQG